MLWVWALVDIAATDSVVTRKMPKASWLSLCF